MKNSHRALYYCLFLGLIVIGFLPYINLDFYADSLKTITAWKVDSSSWSYWTHIYTQPIHGPQYRPTSFFSYYYIMGNLFGDSYSAFFLVGILMASIACFLLFQLVINLNLGKRVALLSSLLFLCHPNHVLFLTEASHSLKYYGPLIVLLLILGSVAKTKSDLRKSLLFSSILLLTLTIHEASFIFSAIVLLFICQRQGLKKHHFLVALPSFLWLIVRLSVWGLPKSDEPFYVKVGAGLFTKLVFFIEYSFQFLKPGIDIEKQFTDLTLSSWTLLFVLVMSIIVSYTTNKKTWIISLAGLLAILPFAAMSKHLYGTRSFWGTPFWMILFAITINAFILKITSKLPKKINLSFKYDLLYFSFCIVIALFISFYHAHWEAFESPKYRVREIVKRSSQLVTDSTERQYYWAGKDLKPFSKFIIIPGTLAWKYPKMNALIRYSPPSSPFVIVRQGVYYVGHFHDDGSIKIVDPFQVPVDHDKIDFHKSQLQQTYQGWDIKL